jgi:hypothetical protein
VVWCCAYGSECIEQSNHRAGNEKDQRLEKQGGQEKIMFTEQEQARIKHFLSYPDWVSLSQSIQLGYPAASQPLFLVDDAFKRLTEGGEYSVRKDLCECEQIECQISDARSRLKAVKIGNLELNPNETRQLRQELLFWITRLADDLGVVSDPYSQMMYKNIMGMGGVNASVVG